MVELAGDGGSGGVGRVRIIIVCGGVEAEGDGDVFTPGFGEEKTGEGDALVAFVGAREEYVVVGGEGLGGGIGVGLGAFGGGEGDGDGGLTVGGEEIGGGG